MGAGLRAIFLAFVSTMLSSCATEPLQEIAALSATPPTTIFTGILDLPIMEGHVLDPGCGDHDPASACVVIAEDATGGGNKAFDAAETAKKVYSGQLKKQGWTPLAYPFDETFRSPDGARCVSLWAGSFSSYGRRMRVAVQIDLDPTALSCWETPIGGPSAVILPGLLDLPVNQGDFLRDYSSPGSERARVRFGTYKRNDGNPYVGALVARGWRIIAQTRSEVALMEPAGGRERCLVMKDMVVIVSRSDKSWAYTEFLMLPDGVPCGLEQDR